MAPSRLEVNFTRLLSRCESIALQKRGETEWRLEKYVAALEDMLVGLKKSSSKPAAEVLKDYSRKVDFLKGLLEVEKLPSPGEKAPSNQLLDPGQVPGAANEKMSGSRSIHSKKGRVVGEMKIEFMGAQESSKTGSTVTDMRHRRALRLQERRSVVELDAVMQQQRLLQEKLAEDVLHLARNLKNNSLASQGLLRHHSQVLSPTLEEADGRPEYLGAVSQSEQLKEHARKSVTCFPCLLLVLVCFIFISTILFIRLFPKLR
ncbi:hypothetical protein AGOR_G00244040 [Albula goreensis]|uniref:Vesicle transport protein USE1 n=1 Tax=Albula goreensis TaxID=1534307 RepID=A0A8T3CFF4_9TELE|nr:hypothetical protein AGOR_G00244040 [Albula goreensis]